MLIRIYLFFIFIFPLFVFGKKELNCSALDPIQIQYTDKHVNQAGLSRKLQRKTANQLIKTLDSGKLYFIQPDVVQIRKWFSNLFKDIKDSNCSSLVKLYNLFYQRVKERNLFAQKEISRKGFKLDKQAALILDSDKRSYAKNRVQLDDTHRQYIHYELASIMSVEDNLEKARKHLKGIYERMEKKVYTWNPAPSKDRLQFCAKEDEKNKLVKTCKYEKWYAVYLDSFARALDPHSSYFSQYELDDFEINMKLSLEGVGASLSSRYGYTVIERLLPGGAAFRSGQLKKKDRILAIGQKRQEMINIFGWDLRDVVEMVRGKKGTKVHLKILRNLKNGKKKSFLVTLVRDKIQIKDGAVSIIYSKKKIKGKDNMVGVIRIPSFYGGGSSSRRSVSKDTYRLIQEAKKKNLSGLVLDLSGNGGGVLTEAVEVAGLFLEKGNIVRQMTTHFRGFTNYQTMKDDDGRIAYSGNLVVLVNRSSASASEIVAGALQDYKRAVIVGGDHTFGKGSIQSVENLSRGLGAIKVTVGLFFIPGGKSIQKMGILSDISLPSLMSVDDSYGEKKLDHVLPRRHTASFLTRTINSGWKKITKNMIEKLKLRSLYRVKKSDKFKKINEEIAKFKEKLKNQKKVKVETVLGDAKKRNEEERENEDLAGLDFSDPRFQKKYLKRADVEEAINIVWDMSSMGKSSRSLVQTN